MRLRHLAALVVAMCLCARLGGAETTPLERDDGTQIPVRLAGDWTQDCPPTVILSHGLGGDADALRWVDGAATAAGYRMLVMGHAESGPALLREVLRQGAARLLDPAPWRAREADLKAALAYATRLCRPKVLVLGGHSMGAAQTMFEAGAIGLTPYRGQDQFDAYIAVSPQGVSWAFASPDAWRKVEKPVLMLTGTRDHGFGGDTWEGRLVAFQGLPPGKKRLAVVEGANHLNLGGFGNRRAQAKLAAVTEEFLRQLLDGWAPTALGAEPGLAIQEK